MDLRELGWGERGQGWRETLQEMLAAQLWSVCNLDPVCFALQVILHQEGHMDDGLTLQRCQREESQAARIIRNTTALFSQFVRYVHSFPFYLSFYSMTFQSHLPTSLQYCECF